MIRDTTVTNHPLVILVYSLNPLIIFNPDLPSLERVLIHLPLSPIFFVYLERIINNTPKKKNTFFFF